MEHSIHSRVTLFHKTVLGEYVPVGIMNVHPSSSVIRSHLSTLSAKNMSPCFPDKVHSSYNFKFFSVGGISQNTCVVNHTHARYSESNGLKHKQFCRCQVICFYHLFQLYLNHIPFCHVRYDTTPRSHPYLYENLCNIHQHSLNSTCKQSGSHDQIKIIQCTKALIAYIQWSPS